MLVSETDSIAEELGLSDAIIASRLAAVNLSAADRETLKKAWPLVEKQSEKFVKRLYQRFRSTSQLTQLLAHESRVERLMGLQQNYLKELFTDAIDRDYVVRRLTIGLVHHRIRVTPQWYLATCAHFVCDHIDLFLTESASYEEAIDRIDAFHKSVLFDASLVLDAYGRREEASLSLPQPGTADETSHQNNQQSTIGKYSAPSEALSSEPGMARIRLSDAETQTRAAYLELDAESLLCLQSLREPIERATGALLSEFYEFISSAPELSRLLHDGQIQRLTQQVRSYWREFAGGRIDRPYAASRMRIGVIHEQIGLELQWYLVGFGRQVSGLLRSIPASHSDVAGALKALFRTVYFDMTFVIDAYMEARAHTLLTAKGYANQLMAGLTSAVVVINNRNRIQFANDAFISMAQIEPAMLYLMDLSAIIAVPELLAVVDQLKRDSASRVCSIGKWGERLLRITVMELEESGERRRRSIAVILDDVSTMIQLANTMEHDALIYKRLTNAVAAVVWEMDCGTQTIHSISNSVISLIGHRDVGLLGRPKSWLQCISPIDRDRFEASCNGLTLNDRSTCEYRMIRADGQEIWVRSYLSRIQGEDGRNGIAAVTLDITNSRQADLLRFTALEHVAAGISHVVNNALTAISGNIELYTAALKKDRVRAALDSESCLDDAVLATRRAAAVIGQLQTFSGGQYLRSKKANINELILQTLPAIRRQMGNSVQLRTELAPELWYCRVDPDMLRTAIGNLCDNAIEAMPTGGELILRTQNLDADSTTFDDPAFQQEWVQLSIQDSGFGMCESVRERAFEPFFTTAGLAEHYGLGLSMVYGFVAQSGGHTLLTSSVGNGTLVSLRFPRLTNESSEIKAAQDSRRRIVLIVDPDESVRFSTSRLVQHLGFKSLIAGTASDALELIARNPILVLLTEASLGNGLDGLSFARQLETRSPQTSVVVMTGSGRIDRMNNQLPDAWQILAKPFSADELSAVLKLASTNKNLPQDAKTLLSPREREVLQWIAAGKSQAEAAIILGISERTVEQHVRNARQKLNAVNTIQAIVEAIALNEISK